MIKKRKINLITLGCPKNVVDSEVLMRQLEDQEYEFVENSDESEVAIINSCGFIQSAKQESIDTILHAARLKREGRIKKLIVMGCLSERYSKELIKEIPEVDVYIGTNKLERVLNEFGVELKYELLGERKITTPSHYAYLKISEGCDRPCSFCSIPLIRGKHFSKPIEHIVQEAKYLSSKGVKELILIAQDTTYYGLDLYGKRVLAQLLDQLSEIEGIEWIKLMYAFPHGFPLDVLDRFKANPKLCRYLDIPLQHISDSILTSMKRSSSSKETFDLIRKIRDSIPDIALRTTLIVGYPNEGEKEFEELLTFIKEMQFDRLGVFTYSQEEDTAAYLLGDPVPQSVKEARQKQILETQREISFQKNQQLIGKTMRIIIDQRNDNAAVGRTEYDAPEIDNEVSIEDAHQLSVGEFYPIEIVDADAYDMFGIVSAVDPSLRESIKNKGRGK
ncbi:MAG: 30S ribosomal protein S12 methylthiotransferase RimO [Bacteroidota bacterium]|nr:30S ribosomal protein S12 methylthiotransferase RimO [Bacteroidota bacterium]